MIMYGSLLCSHVGKQTVIDIYLSKVKANIKSQQKWEKTDCDDHENVKWTKSYQEMDRYHREKI